MSFMIEKTSAEIILCPVQLRDEINANPNMATVCEFITVNDGVNLEITFEGDGPLLGSPDEDAIIDEIIEDLECLDPDVDAQDGPILQQNRISFVSDTNTINFEGSVAALKDVDVSNLDGGELLDSRGNVLVGSLRARNPNSYTIPNNTPVYVVGFCPACNRIIVDIADASDEAKMPAIGVSQLGEMLPALPIVGVITASKYTSGFIVDGDHRDRFTTGTAFSATGSPHAADYRVYDTLYVEGSPATPTGSPSLPTGSPATGQTQIFTREKITDPTVSGDINANGIVAINGETRNSDTTGSTVNDPVYVAVGGGTSLIKPGGEDTLIQVIARVTYVDSTAGRIIVTGSGRPNDTPNLPQDHVFVGDENGRPITLPLRVATENLVGVSDLSDVELSGSPKGSTVAIGDLLTYIDGSPPTWGNVAPTDVDIEEDHIIYVGKHGDDSNDGKTIGQAVLTFGQALTLCNAQTPTVSNQWGAVCLDNGVYAEDVALTTEYVRIFAANATLDGKITLTDHTSFEFEAVFFSTTGNAVEMVSGSDTAYGEIKHLKISGGGNGVVNNSSGILNVEIEYFEQTGGIGFENSSISHADIQDWDVYGDSPTLVKTTGGMTNVRSANHSDRGGSGTSLGYDCDAGTTNIFVIRSCPDQLYDVESGATLNLMVIETCGASRSNDGTVNELETSHASDTSNPHSTTIDNLDDTTITSVASGEVLKWNGSAWINNTLAEADIAADSNVLHLTGNETAAGNKTFTGNTKLGHTFTSSYTLSVQENADAAYIEILNSGGAGKGAFFGMENYLTTDDFCLYNYQGGPITFYTDTTASTEVRRMVIQPDGDVEIKNLGLGVVKSSADGTLSSGTITESDISDLGSYGDASGPGSSTDHAIARFNGTSGKLLDDAWQWTIADNGAAAAIVSTIADGTPVLMLRHNGASARSFLEMKSSSGSDMFDFRMDSSQDPVFRVSGNLLTVTSGGVGINKLTAAEDLDVDGNIAVTGTVDGRDVASDGSTQDSHIADGTIHFTQAAISITESQISDLGSYSVVGHNHDSDYVEITGDTMSGALTVNAAVTTGDLRVQHDTVSDSDLIIDANGRNGAAGLSFSKDGGSGFLALFPNSQNPQWIAGDPAAGAGVNTFYLDVDNAGTFRINTLGGAGAGGDVMVSSGAPVYPAGDGTSDLGKSDKQWDDVYGVTFHGDGSNLTGLTESQITDLGNYAVIGGAHHDGFSDFVANEHINHTSVTLTAGAGLAGGGDISANRSFSVNVQNSIEIDTDTLQLVGDSASPGNDKLYGTNGSGVKGWYDAAGASVGGTSKQMDSWTLLSGSLYYNNFAHNLGTDEVTTFLYDTSSKQTVKPEYIEIIDTDTIRVVVEGNSEDLTCNVVSGSGPAGPQGDPGSGNDIIVQDEGTPLTTAVTKFNFAGSGVTVTEPVTDEVLVTVTGGGDVTSSANITDHSVVRGDGGAKGVQDSTNGGGSPQCDVTINDQCKLNIVSNINHDYALSIQNLNANGDGFSIRAGENLGDIAFHIADWDNTFQIMEMEADQGFITLGKTYTQTLSDNGVVYGMDNQHGGSASDFNTQSGTYRVAGENAIEQPPTVDHTGAGTIVSATVDTNGVGFGAALYMASDGNFDTTDADSSSTMPCRAIALESGTGTKKVLLRGFVRDNSWNWTPGGDVYVSTTTGTFTQTAPSGSGDQVQKIGFAWTADIIYFQPGDYTVVEVA